MEELTLFSIYSYAILFLALIVQLIVCIKKYCPSTKKMNLPPGSLGLPFIGESLSFISLNRRGMPEKFIYERTAKFSSQIFKTSLFGELTVVFCGAEGNKFIFSNESKLVVPWWPKTVDKLFPLQEDDGVSNGEKAMIMRKIFQTVFKPDSFNKYIGIMDTIAQRYFASSWHGASNVQVFPLALRYTSWVACSTLLSIEDSEVAKLEEPVNHLASGFFCIPINFPGTSFHRSMTASKTIRRQLHGIIQQRKTLLLESKESPKRTDFLSQMILYQDENGQHLSDEVVTHTIIGIILAGHHTTTSAITSTVKYLAEFPHVYDEVFNEQMEISKSKAPGELLNWNDIQKMKYSWNVACEVLRLAPPIPGTFRQAIKDFDYGGYSIPKGCKIYWNALSTQINPKCFPEPEKFDASRFDSRCAPFTFVSFGGGPRMCPGKEFARFEMLVFMHNIVKRFKWEKCLPKEYVHINPYPMPPSALPIQLYPHQN